MLGRRRSTAPGQLAAPFLEIPSANLHRATEAPDLLTWKKWVDGKVDWRDGGQAGGGL
jgi:hypothetical protein